MDILRPWLTLSKEPVAEALTEMTLEFLLHLWANKILLSNFSFNIGKAIVKVKKNGNDVCKSLAEKVQERWTEILKSDDSKAKEPPTSQIPSSGYSIPSSTNPPGRNTSSDMDGDYIYSLPLGMCRSFVFCLLSFVS